ncbi:MAG TPA: hypothetical protein VK151_11605 [Fluviicola sp.]|nr:hypothetical protein [Fluviicola sp.]
MGAAETKLSLVQMIIESEDKTFIAKVLAYARSLKTQKEDWVGNLPDYLVKEIELAIEEADSGKDIGITNTEMIRKYKEKYPHLNL